jgi:hypothetical protein
MMEWHKRGLIYGPDEKMPWAQNSALTPTPILMGDVIRVYAGFRDGEGKSRIGYVDIDADDPSRVIAVSKNPVLDIGLPGMFDDNGVILGDVIKVGEAWSMYYIGFQLVKGVKFLAFTGLALSKDGEQFTRVQKVPILDRSDEGVYIRAIHTVLSDDDRWKAWYAAGSGWSLIDGIPYPQYEIKYIESKDGLSFEGVGKACVKPSGNEYRIGRPRVFKQDGLYHMFYTKGTLSKEYLPGYAQSPDGIRWVRKDEEVGLTLSGDGWDCRNICYPTILKYKGKVYLFYNGNDMGRSGFGYAELASWD